MQAAKPVTKPTKQRKMLYQAPQHVRYRLFAAPLSPELRASRGIRTLPVRRGDTVRVLRGDHKGFEGKISEVDRKKYRIYVEGLTREKVDGTTIFVPVHPSKVMVTNLNLDDKWRKKILERKKGAREKIVEVEGKPSKKALKAKEKAVEEKLPEKKPKRRKKKPAEKTKEEKAEETVEETKEKPKPKAKRPRAKRKTTEKTEGGK